MDDQTPHRANELLNYLPEYGVLVCRECRFAIQPSALPSHLLRHRIYRSDRRDLLDSLSRLVLAEPDDVPTPSPNSRPLPGLPVHSGYRCLAVDCSHACASHKRMTSHWSEVHGERDSKNVRALPVLLQTFFRGNKIRYFEVSADGHAPTPPVEHADVVNSTSGGQATSPQTIFLSPVSSHSEGREAVTPAPDLHPLPTVKALQYLHFFTTSTSMTLYRSTNEAQSLFWTYGIPPQAFQHHFLLCSLLSMASLHQACETADLPSAAEHRQASSTYQMAALRSLNDARPSPTAYNATALIAHSRLSAIWRYADAGAHDSATPGTDMHVATVGDFITCIRSQAETLISLEHLLPLESAFKLGQDQLVTLRGVHNQDTTTRALSQGLNTPLNIFHALNSLPTRIAQLERDRVSASSCVDAAHMLTTSVGWSYASTDTAALWDGIESWAINVSEQFLELVAAGNAAALVVTAHWLVCLVRRAEVQYWFMRGQCHRLIAIINMALDESTRTILRDLASL